jgi:hypothetical protein
VRFGLRSAAARYGYYFDTIPSSYLAPFSDRWTLNIQYRTGGEEFPELMEQMWEA